MKLGTMLLAATLTVAVTLTLSNLAEAKNAGEYLAKRFGQREVVAPTQPNVNYRLQEFELLWREGRETKPRKYRRRQRDFRDRGNGDYNYDPGGAISASPDNTPTGAPSVSAPGSVNGPGMVIGPGDWGGTGGKISCPTC